MKAVLRGGYYCLALMLLAASTAGSSQASLDYAEGPGTVEYALARPDGAPVSLAMVVIGSVNPSGILVHEWWDKTHPISVLLDPTGLSVGQPLDIEGAMTTLPSGISGLMEVGSSVVRVLRVRSQDDMPVVMHVSKDGSDSNDGSTWELRLGKGVCPLFRHELTESGCRVYMSLWEESAESTYFEDEWYNNMTVNGGEFDSVDRTAEPPQLYPLARLRSRILDN